MVMKLATKKRNIFYVHKVHARDKSYVHLCTCACGISSLETGITPATF